MVSRFLLRQQLVQYLEWYLARVKQSQTTLCNRGALEQVMTSSWLRAAKARKNPSTATVTRTRVGERHDGGGATESPLTAREAQRASAVWAWFEALGAREREGVLAVTDRSWIATVREMRRRKRGGEGNFRVYSSRRVLASGAAMKFDYVPCARAADDSRRMESALRLLDGGSVGDALLLERELIADANALRALLESLSHGRFLTSVSSSSRGGAATAATPAAKGVASASPAVAAQWLLDTAAYSLGAFVASKLELNLRGAFSGASTDAKPGRALASRRAGRSPQLELRDALDAFWRGLSPSQRVECAKCGELEAVAAHLGCSVDDVLRDDACASRLATVTLDEADGAIAQPMRCVALRVQNARAEQAQADLLAEFAGASAGKQQASPGKKKKKKRRAAAKGASPFPRVALAAEAAEETRRAAAAAAEEEAERAREKANANAEAEDNAPHGAGEEDDPPSWQTVSKVKKQRAKSRVKAKRSEKKALKEAGGRKVADKGEKKMPAPKAASAAARTAARTAATKAATASGEAAAGARRASAGACAASAAAAAAATAASNVSRWSDVVRGAASRAASSALAEAGAAVAAAARAPTTVRARHFYLPLHFTRIMLTI